MFTVLCRIKDIDYSSGLTVLSPMFERFHIPLNVGRAALKLMPNVAKQRILISAVNMNKEKILDILQNLANSKDIKIAFNDIQMCANGNMLEIEIKFDNLDYKGIAELVLPMIAPKIGGNSKLCFLNELLEDSQVAGNVVCAILDNIPEEKKNNMVSSAIECYQNEILKALNNLLYSKKIVAKICQINVKST